MNKKIVLIAAAVVAVAVLGLLVRAAFIKASSAQKAPAAVVVAQSAEAIAPAEEKQPVIKIKESGSLRDIRALADAGKRAEAVKKLDEIITSSPGTKQGYDAVIMLAGLCEEDKNLVRAKELYSIALTQYSGFCQDPAAIQEKLNTLNTSVLFSPSTTQYSETYTVASGDNLTKIAKKYNTTVELIKRSNNLASDTIFPGMKLKVQKQPFRIVIDKSQSMLTLLIGDEVIKTYIVATGKNNSTPVGNFKIGNKLVDPPWFSPGGKVIRPGDPENALGTRWMGFSIATPDYGIHGTNDPSSIGYQSTDGCIRMQNADVEELYSIVPVGTEVAVLD